MRLFAPVFRLSHNNVNLFILFNVFLFVSQYAFAQTQPAPTISNFTPADICQGQTVTINGANFQNATGVRLGNDNAVSFTVNSTGTAITAVVSYSAQTGGVSVTTPGGTVNANTTLTIRPAPRPALQDISTKDIEFSNCDGSQTYLLRVKNLSATPQANSDYTINWGDGSPAFTQRDWPSGAEISHNYGSQGYFLISISITPPNGCTQTKQYQFYNGKNPLASLSTSTSTTGL